MTRPRIAWADPLRCCSTAQFSHAVLLPEGWNALCGVDGYVLGAAQEAPGKRKCRVCESAAGRALAEAMAEWAQTQMEFEEVGDVGI